MEWTIGEVARRAGIATSAIRYYERQGLLEPADRRSGRRVYGAEILDRLTLIRLAKSAGFTIAEIRRLIHGFDGSGKPGPRWRALAGRKLAELDRRIDEARQMKGVLERVRRCECPTFEVCARAFDEQRRALTARGETR